MSSRVAILGLGAIGQRVLKRLKTCVMPEGVYAALVSSGHSAQVDDSTAIFDNTESLLAWQPDLAVECAGHEVVGTVVPRLLCAGVDVMIVSVGAMSKPTVREALDRSASAGCARFFTVSGAIGGLDALAAARLAGLESVSYTGRKPPHAWADTPAASVCDLRQLSQPTVIFRGSADESSRLYPKNANVTAAVALAGLGFERTSVCLVADPTIDTNVHELEAIGAFGRFLIRLENNPLPENPRTSWLAVLSIEEELRKYLGVRQCAQTRRSSCT